MKYIFFLFCIVYLVSCSGLSSDDRDRDRDRDRRRGHYDEDGRVNDPCSSLYSPSTQNNTNNEDDDDTYDYDPDRLPVELEEANFFSMNCNNQQGGPPLTLTDIITGSLFNINTFDRQARSCVSQKLEQANDCLCETRDKLEAQRSEYLDDKNITEASRVQYSLNQLNQIEQRFKSNLNKIRNRAQGQANRKVTNIGILNFFLTDHLYGWEIVFDTEAHIRCYSSYEDDRNNSRNSNSRYSDRDRYNDRNRNRNRYNVRDRY